MPPGHDGNFDGWAWGENIGWIHFQNPSIPYKVQTAWAPSVFVDTDGDGGEDADVHGDPDDVRELAFQMGVNLYVLSMVAGR